MIYIANSFTLAMLPQWVLEDTDSPACGERINVSPVVDPAAWLEMVEAARGDGPAVSAVGHADTAALFSRTLGREVPMSRASIRLDPGDILLVGQYRGPRMPEGATELPVGARIVWACVSYGD